jgi:hypothetical protein
LIRPPGVEDDTLGADTTRIPSNEVDITTIVTRADPEWLFSRSYTLCFESVLRLLSQVVAIEIILIARVVDGALLESGTEEVESSCCSEGLSEG